MVCWLNRILSLFKVGRCCADCQHFHKCWEHINELNLENPSCDRFEEVKNEKN